MRPPGPGGSERDRGQDVTIHVESETDEQRLERCDHEGTTEPLNALRSILTCTACGKTWTSRFGAGAATERDQVEERRSTSHVAKERIARRRSSGLLTVKRPALGHDDSPSSPSRTWRERTNVP